MTDHPFEKQGLGVAPFRFVRVQTNVYVACPGAPTQPGGTCDYCANGIKYECVVKDANGKQFIVGTDCVAKVYRDYKNVSVLDDVSRRTKLAVAALKTQERHEREDANIAAMSAELRTYNMERRQHSQKWRAEKGETMLDEFNWWMKNAGRSGRLKWLKNALQIVKAMEKAKGSA